MKREGISITLGFTANVNVELQVATLQETVTVTGESPVIDTSATRIQQNFKLEQLQSIPNGRDMWALLAVTPSVQMARIDVGGNRAGTQTGYTAYGFNGQVRVLIEGINTTEGTGGAGFYFDYASLEEAFLGTSGQSAKCRTPACRASSSRSRAATSSRASTTSIGTTTRCRARTSPTSTRCQPPLTTARSAPHSNEISNYYDTAINVGGPIKSDKMWWHFTYREQENQVAQPNFRFDSHLQHETVESRRARHLPSQPEPQADWLLPVGTEESATAPPTVHLHLHSTGTNLCAGLGELGLKGEWNGTHQRQALRRSAVWRLRLLLPAHREQRLRLLLA